MTFTDNEKAIINSSDSVKLVRLEFPNGESDTIGEHQIYQESLNLEESIFEGDNLTFGKCNGSIFKIRVADFVEDIQNARMNVYVHYTNEDLGEVDVPFGKYIVSSVERTSDRRWRDITATDYMTLFDVDIANWYNDTLYPTASTTHTVAEIRTMLCSYIGVTQETATLINDGLVIGKAIQLTSLSGRDLLQNICEINACFGHFDWNGVLQYITLGYSGLYPSETIFPSQNLYPRGRSADSEYILTYKQGKCNYEDYDVKEINSVSIVKEDGGLGAVYKLPQVVSEEEVENRYIISGNILLYEFGTEDLQEIAQKICNKISGCSYCPNSTEIYGGIYMSLGQSYVVNATVIIGSDIIDNTFESYVLKRTIKGIQAMSQVLEAQGEAYQPETQSHDILSELTILNGKSAKYRRDLEGLEVEYRDFAEGTESHFEITDQAIQSEVTRASNSEGRLSSRITQNANSISSEVTRATNAEGSLSSRIEQTAHTISMKVNNVEDGSGELSKNASVGITITLLDENGNAIDSGNGTITLNGDVIFTSNLTDGVTRISGDNITTGTIDATKVNVINVIAKSVDAEDITGTTIIGKTFSGGNVEGSEIYATDTLYMKSLAGKSPVMTTLVSGSLARVLQIGSSSLMTTITSSQEVDINTATNIGGMLSAGKIQTRDSEVSTQASNCRFTTGDDYGFLRKATGSSIKYKHNFSTEYNKELNPHNLYNVKVYQYKYQTNYLENKEDIRYDSDVIGFIAEELDKHYPVAVDYYNDKDKGKKIVTDWNERYIIPPMLKLIQEQHEEIEELKDELATLKEQVAFLMERSNG